MTAHANNTAVRGKQRKLSKADLTSIRMVVAEARSEEHLWDSARQSSRALVLAGNTWGVHDWDED